MADMISELTGRFPDIEITQQQTRDGIPTVWLDRERVHEILSFLKNHIESPYKMLFDLTAIDERTRREPAQQPPADFSVVYTLLSIDRNEAIRIKVPLLGEYPSLHTVTDIWPNANWYEREIWDMFGIKVEGHPFLKRILTPPGWVGHPLRKEHPARATEMEQYTLPEDREEEDEYDLQFHPEEYGLARSTGDVDYMFLNLGPHHPGTHGLLRVILQLDGEEISDAAVDIGWHHRAAEKMAERQTFHTYIPYTDRVDYLAGTLNN
ncbi:MAG TPA: NADH-quinone oxidoreductase subunit C, partial [Armatimonadota bacterium]|nr:NADH-quinone oxidoreductase subunit C [Armatimonadota bacterium]